MGEHHLTQKRMQESKRNGLGCLELGHVLSCDRCIRHLRHVYDKYLDRTKSRHHSHCRCTKCRIDERRGHYQKEYRQQQGDPDMEFDQQLESMASKLAQDFMTYFKRMYGTPSLLEDLRTRLGELGNWRQHANTKFDSLKARIKGLETSEKSVLGRIKILETASLDMVNQKFEEQADVNLDFESRLLKVEKRAHDVPEEFVRRTREATKVVDRVKLLESQVANARVGKLEGFFGDHEAMARRHQHVQATTSGVYARIEKLEEDNTLLHETLTKMRQDHVALQNRINRFEDQDEVQAWMDASDNPVLAVAQDVEKLKSKTKVLDSMGHQTTTLHQRLRKLEDRLEDYSDGDAERAFESINMLVERVEKLEGQVIGKVQASGIAQRIEVKLDKVLEIVDQLGEA